MDVLTVGAVQDRATGTQRFHVTTDQEFWSAWLAFQCGMIADVKGGLVLCGPPPHGPFGPVAVWPHVQRSVKHLALVAEQALQKGTGVFAQRQADHDPAAPAPHWCELAFPLTIAGQVYGVVVLEVTPRPVPQLQAVLQQLALGVAWLEFMLQQRPADTKEAGSLRLQAVLEVLATTVSHEGFDEAVVACVTDLAVRLECERVSFGYVRGRHTHLKAISHSAQFSRNAPLTHAIESAMDEAFDQEAVIVYPPNSTTTLQITRAHETLARQHGEHALCSVPLYRAASICGVLTFERSAEQPFDAATIELCEAMAALAGPVLEAKRRESRWLVTKAVAALWFQVTHLLGARRIGLKLASLGLSVALIASLVVKTDYRVSATTRLEAQTRRVTVAPFDGYITDVRVRAGDLVQAGDVLCILDDRDLKLEQLKWRNQREQYVKQYHLAMAQGKAAQAKIAAAQMAQAAAELELVDNQLERTQVRTPYDGVVVTGDLYQAIGAPVERGQVLFEVAPLDAYRVILQVDERDTADVAVGQRGSLALSAFPTEPLPFVVRKITPVSIAREGRNYFRVEAQLEHTPAQLRPGMEGIGKITIDRRLLLWTWTHRAIDWLRLLVWSWWP